MHFPWGPKELEKAAHGLLMFTPEELKKMRAGISVRISREAPVAELLPLEVQTKYEYKA
jgi:hypothetical protein